MGVALFLGDVAEKSDDMELLGMATRAKKIAKEKLAEDSRRFQDDQQQEEERWKRAQRMHDAVENACRPVLASIGQGGVDMSKYRKAIEGQPAIFQ